MSFPYRKASSYFREKFGARVYRVAVDAGFTCPNRDGTLARSGCIFCDEEGSRATYVNPQVSIKEQVLDGIEKLKRSYKAEKFIVYFQSYSNTYASVDKLHKIYHEGLSAHPDIIGISVSTRPDLLSEDVLDLLAEIRNNYFVMLEIGVQSFNYRSLIKSRRFHTVADTIDAILRAKKRNLNVVAHMILGLFDEIEPEAIDGGRILSVMGVDGVKIHHLYVIKGTDLEILYKRGRIKVYENPEDFARLVVRFLENLRPDMVIHRVQGFASTERLVAPLWSSDKHIIARLVESIIKEKGTYQGKLYRYRV